ncbi:MAG: S41 family peptidase [bacterium]|nr:S41 family peptidase [bacterium]
MKKFLKNRYFVIGISIIVVITLTAGAFYFGYQQGIKKPQTVIIRGVANLEEGNLEVIDFSLFWDAWRILKDKHVEADKINNQDLVYGAISGLFGALKDPNSVFFPPTDAKKFTEDISGEFSGIGAEIGIRNEQLVIIAPLKNTPAEKAGLKAADKILKINDTVAVNLSVDEAVKLIRGERGTTVILTILRNGWEKPKEISIIRNIIQVPTLDWEMLALSEAEGKDIAYIHLYNFYEKVPFLFYQMVTEMIFKNPKGIVLDLRNNPGGYLEASVNLAGWFLKPGEVVVKEEFRSDESQIFKAHGNGLFREMPMVILINEGSASASEILAGALRDNRGVKLIGKKSFGKGTVQELETLKNGSMAKITVAHWIMPKGQLIEKHGLTPDYEIDLTEDDIKAGRDPQLEKAMEILKSEL